MSETTDARLKRLAMRAARRGMREMDLLLGPFAAARLAQMSPEGLDLFESLIAENDQEIFAWLTGAQSPPPKYAAFIAQIAQWAALRPPGGA